MWLNQNVIFALFQRKVKPSVLNTQLDFLNK